MYGSRSGFGNYINWPVCGSQASMLPASGLTGYRRGLGCGCGGQCGCSSRGLGYFDSGWDLSGWGWMEWGTVLMGAYVLISTFSTTKRGYGKVKRYAGRRRRAARMKRTLEAA
jgi:hypothetical protein